MDLSIIYTDIDCARLQRSALVYAVFSVYLVFPNRIIDQRIRPSERRAVVENPGSEVRCSGRGNLRGHEVVIELNAACVSLRRCFVEHLV